MKYENVKDFSVKDLIICWDWDSCEREYEEFEWDNINISECEGHFAKGDLNDLEGAGLIQRVKEVYKPKCGDIVKGKNGLLYLCTNDDTKDLNYFGLSTFLNYQVVRNPVYIHNIKEIIKGKV